jgi:two-component system, OmpR family, sensor kinase
MAEQKSLGFALVCGTDGAVLETLSDEVGLPNDFLPGRKFDALMIDGSDEKYLNFLSCVRTGRPAFDWEMDIRTKPGPLSVFLSGALDQDRLLIVGSTTLAGARRFACELMAMNREQVNQLHTALKQIALERPSTARHDHDLYNELTLLNNELADAHRALAKSNVELDRLQKERARFIGMAAHDLRNTIATIQTYSDFVLEETAGALRQELIEFISIIGTSSLSMLYLVDDLLDVSVIESGGLKLDLQPVDLSKLLDRNLTLNRVLAAKKNIRIDLDAPGPSCTVRADLHKIDQVLNNLVSNAVKFSPQGAVVVVRVQVSPTEVAIHVIDTGPGIPEAELELLFRPFHRTSVKTSAGERSTGLGLAIVKRIIEGHAGRVWVRSAVGSGSAFSCSLPIAEPSGG